MAIGKTKVLGYCGVCWLRRFAVRLITTLCRTTESVSLPGVCVTAHTYHNKETRSVVLRNAVSYERSLGLAAMPDTPGSRIVGPKARRKKWSVHPSSGYLASRPFRTLNWLAWGTRHAREEGAVELFLLWRHSAICTSTHGSRWRTRGPQRGSLKQVPRLRARTGHAPCTQAAAFGLPLLSCAFALFARSLSLGQTRGGRMPYVFAVSVDQAYQARTR